MKTLGKLFGMKRTIILVAVALISVSSFAKSSCCVKVLVTDHFYQPIDYATVTLKDAETQKVLKVMLSNDKGEVKLKKLRPGNYVLDVKTPGFSTNKTNALTITEGGTKMMEKVVVLESNLMEEQNKKETNVSQVLQMPDELM
ncbi:MAG: carboxypeptidase-like regulatory domain-containing protein [Bacteroidales bacterium]